MLDWKQRVLEELIYERVKLQVDMVELCRFEQDLTVSIDRALDECGRESDHRHTLARNHMEKAWQRIADEWLVAEDRLDTGCPFCTDGEALTGFVVEYDSEKERAKRRCNRAEDARSSQ